MASAADTTTTSAAGAAGAAGAASAEATKKLVRDKINGTVTLNDGRDMPYFGLGVWQSKKGTTCANAVKWAIEAGYRHIDTACLYGNEESVAEGIKMSGVPRSEIWITTKLWDSDHGYDSAIAACNESLRRLDTDYIDLYLIHSPNDKAQRLDSWRALEKLKADGKCKSIGVSNYGVHHLKELLKASKTVPAVNQIELHPFNQRKEIVDFCTAQGITMEAYAPLTRGKKLKHKVVAGIAKEVGKTPAQALLRWSLQKGFIIIPKSIKKERIQGENCGLFDWDLSEPQMKDLDSLEEHLCTCWDPSTRP